jgi:hypothetical protein
VGGVKAAPSSWPVEVDHTPRPPFRRAHRIRARCPPPSMSSDSTVAIGMEFENSSAKMPAFVSRTASLARSAIHPTSEITSAGVCPGAWQSAKWTASH